MDCFCGCGTKVPRDLIDLNVRVGEVAYDLLAWDKYRTIGKRDPADVVETDQLIYRGSACFGRLLLTMHGDREFQSLRESHDWLAESRALWLKRSEMFEKGSFLRGPTLRITDDDISRLDRAHPDQSFSATVPAPESDTDGGAATDVAGQLERLGVLRAEDVLTEEEFQAAKARVLGTIQPPAAG